jgi:hypothetical protein
MLHETLGGVGIVEINEGIFKENIDVDVLRIARRVTMCL